MTTPSTTAREPVTAAQLTIAGANRASWADLQAIFGTADYPGKCYCQRFKTRDCHWSSMSDRERQDRLREQTRCDDPQARTTTGLVAYLGQEPVGWVAVEPRTAYPRLLRTRTVWGGRQEDKSDDSVWAVTCFVTRKGLWTAAASIVMCQRTSVSVCRRERRGGTRWSALRRAPRRPGSTVRGRCDDGVMSRKVRYPVAGVSEAPARAALRIRTRIRCSTADLAVLGDLARYFSRLQGQDLAVRCGAGLAHDTAVWAERKRAVTRECSSRVAGWITKSSNDAYAAARRNQRRALAGTQQAIAVIEDKVRRPVRPPAARRSLRRAEATAARAEGRAPRRLVFGYRSTSEHAAKRQRLQHLRAVRDKLRRDEEAGRVHITRGGKTLLRNRLHLGQAGLTQDEWQARWRARRWSFGANGETGKRCGNESIRVFPDGTLEIDLPPAFAHLANVTARGVTRYRFDARIAFFCRQREWLAQVQANRAVAYDFCLDPGGKTYLDASFTPAQPPAVPGLATLLADPGLRVLALDLNHGFIAPAVLDRSGNPIARPAHIPLLTEDLPASTRDGHLRAAITAALDLAQARGCALVAVENLGFDQMRATGREHYGSRKWFRGVVCSIPARQFRGRLVAMAARRGIAVAGVPAAYSSIWGRAHWQRPLSTTRHKVSGHTAAAVVLGRRALGHSARRKAPASPGVTAGDQRIEAAGTMPAPAESYHVPEPGRPRERPQGPGGPPRREGTGRRRAPRPPGARSDPKRQPG